MILHFYHCPICGNIIVKVHDGGPTPVCCGSEMRPLVPKREEEYKEKHLPVVKRCDHYTFEVEVGSVPHPMTDEHHIEFICVQTENETIVRHLSPGDDPVSLFVCDSAPQAVYAFCNRHGLWMTETIEDIRCETKKKCKR
ncbi:MAG: desulfoferrodoxin [Bacteroidales bacterium]|nr:desulfoferrodoxin [Bacteroidales bacterium]